MAKFYDVYSVYQRFANSSRDAFGYEWDRLPLSENLPADFRKCVEEALYAMRQAKRISDIEIAKNEVAKKQKELKEVENKLANLESSDYGKTECAQ